MNSLRGSLLAGIGMQKLGHSGLSIFAKKFVLNWNEVPRCIRSCFCYNGGGGLVEDETMRKRKKPKLRKQLF